MAEQKTRGRPKKSSKKIEVKGLKTEYLSTKTDKYDNEISYLKVIDNKKKLEPILSQTCDDCKIPIWKTDDGLYIIKVKKKFMPKQEFEPLDIINVNATFSYYCMEADDKLLQGFWVKIELIEDNVDN